MESGEPLSTITYRRFGVETEVNALDGRSNIPTNEMPTGIEYIAELVRSAIRQPLEISKWGPTKDNNHWVVKPDNSCGVELCSPVTKGWLGLKEVCRVHSALRDDVLISADERCSVHVHTSVDDLDKYQIATVAANWIKCEPVFFDAVRPKRKRNRYCEFIGCQDVIHADEEIDPDTLIQKLGRRKYFSFNTWHLSKERRKSIEFRILEGRSARRPLDVKCWVRLLLHFVDTTSQMILPAPYSTLRPDVLRSMCFLDPVDVFQLLGFFGTLSPGLTQVRNWFLGRLLENTCGTGLRGFWSDRGREIAYQQCFGICRQLGVTPDQLLQDLNADDTAVYDESLVV
jgi:hypothetical protein